MDIQLLTTSCQRALGAMFRKSLGETGLAFLYPFAAPRLFHTFFCLPLRLTAFSEEGEIIFNQVIPAGRFVRLPPTRLVLETDPAASCTKPERNEDGHPGMSCSSRLSDNLAARDPSYAMGCVLALSSSFHTGLRRRNAGSC